MGSNYFNLPDPEQYVCQVLGFTPSRDRLDIKLSHIEKNDVRHISLMSAEYIAGPVCWKGADFRIVPKETSVALVSQLEACATLRKETMMEYHLLRCIPNDPKCLEFKFEIITDWVVEEFPLLGFEETQADQQLKPFNIAGINMPQSDGCLCMFVGYMMPQYPYLTVRIKHPTLGTIFLNFSDVVYMDIPGVWTGATFRVAEQEEWSGLASCLDESATKDHKLFIAPITKVAVGKQVRIVARSAHLTTEAPYFQAWQG